MYNVRMSTLGITVERRYEPSLDLHCFAGELRQVFANLVSNSINLYYAPKPAGPWQLIVTGYKNTGEYKWALPPGLTGPVYLRAEASDRAGNVGRYESPTPVSLEAGKQRVKVIGVGPAQ